MDSVRAMLDEAVENGVFPGGTLLVADGAKVVFELAFGNRTLPPYGSDPVTLDTVYDIASLTKPVATTAVLMRLVKERGLDLDEPVHIRVPELAGAGKDQIRVRDLLCHASGLPAWRPLYLGGNLPHASHGRNEILSQAASEPLERPPRTQSVYSDLGFIVLGAWIERVTKTRLDELARAAVFAPLDMRETRFVDLTTLTTTPTAPFRPSPVAATEVTSERGLIYGEVHDENCHAAGGILGHAGLFSTTRDLSKFASALVAAFHGEKTIYDPEVIRTFFSPCGIPGSTFRLGWDGPSAKSSQAGALWPKSGVGHLGFTGCSLWIDLEHQRWVVLLTNRVHPTRSNERIKQLRPRLHDAIVKALGS